MVMVSVAVAVPSKLGDVARTFTITAVVVASVCVMELGSETHSLSGSLASWYSIVAASLRALPSLSLGSAVAVPAA